MCVWFMKEGKDFNPIWSLVTFLYAGQHTHSGILRKNILSFILICDTIMAEREKTGEIGMWNWGSLHVFQWDLHFEVANK